MFLKLLCRAMLLSFYLVGRVLDLYAAVAKITSKKAKVVVPLSLTLL
jgi:hypothetical protein